MSGEGTLEGGGGGGLSLRHNSSSFVAGGVGVGVVGVFLLQILSRGEFLKKTRVFYNFYYYFYFYGFMVFFC